MVYKPGDYWVICDLCGSKKHRSECAYNYRGFLVCKDTCWEPRHPQETHDKSRKDRQAVPDPRPPNITYIPFSSSSSNSSSSSSSS